MEAKIQAQIKKYEEAKKAVAKILENDLPSKLYEKIYDVGRDEYTSFTLDVFSFSENNSKRQNGEIRDAIGKESRDKFFESVQAINMQDAKENVNPANISMFQKIKNTLLGIFVKSRTPKQELNAFFALNGVKNLRIQKLREIKRFVADILNAKPLENELLAKFNKLVQNDYLNFVNTIALSNEAELLNKLYSIQEELSRLISLKDITSKATIAVGGGFSAGKSQFITSFFADSQIKLPIGVQPVTAIASYIVSGQERIIKGYTKNGGVVDIGIDLYANLSHDFMDELGFNLKTIMPRMAMETKFSDYEHICFIDTPGYNPGGGGTTANDFSTAKEYLDNSDALIWVAPITNGTMYQSDLDFLKDLNIGDKKLYIVANKADLRPKNEIENVLDAFEESLYDNGLDFEGISAYSSENKEELTFRKKSLSDFLNSVRPDFSAKSRIIDELNEILLTYRKEIENQNENNKNIKKTISSLEFDMIEVCADFPDKLTKSFEKLRELTSSKPIKEELRILDTLYVDMSETLNSILIDVFGDEPEPMLEAQDEQNQPNQQRSETMTTHKIAPQCKYFPATTEELWELCNDESVNLGEIDTSKITDMSGLFANSTRSNYDGIEFWDVSNVTNMNSMFANLPDETLVEEAQTDPQKEAELLNILLTNQHEFNGDISNWDVSNVTDMSHMFMASKFNGDISNWDVSNVTNMKSMFYCSNFNGDISEWSVGRVTDMSYMFAFSKFNGDISKWNVSKVTDMSFMFWNSQFNGDVSKWNVGKVTNMSLMFCGSQFNGDISRWNVSNVTNMNRMFTCSKFNDDISNWDVSKVTNMDYMFAGMNISNATALFEFIKIGPEAATEEDLLNGIKSTKVSVTSQRTKFNQDISKWDVSNVTSMVAMFMGSQFNQDISDWNVSNVTSMANMFMGSQFNQDISNWDVGNVVDMSGMFSFSNFNQNISAWNINKASNLECMFMASSFNHDLSSWNCWDKNNPEGTYSAFAFSQFSKVNNWPEWAQLKEAGIEL